MVSSFSEKLYRYFNGKTFVLKVFCEFIKEKIFTDFPKVQHQICDKKGYINFQREMIPSSKKCSCPPQNFFGLCALTFGPLCEQVSHNIHYRGLIHFYCGKSMLNACFRLSGYHAVNTKKILVVKIPSRLKKRFSKIIAKFPCN